MGLVAISGLVSVSAQNLKIHTIGDSTMADYMENTTRTRGWGEMLQEFLSDEVRVINYARGGRSSRSFYEEGIWDRVKKNMNPGDYVLIQFAHNDEKEGGKDGADGRGTEPWTTYKLFLEKYVDETRALKGNPVFVTPIVRRYFDSKGKISPKGCHDLGIAPDDSTLNYVRVMKHVARQKEVPLVDITALTKDFVEKLGAENTIRQIYVPTDGTHTQATGAACYAKLVVEDLKRQGMLVPYIHTETTLVLNPSHLDFQTIYLGDKSTVCFDLTGMNLSPETGILRLTAPKDMTLSEGNGETARKTIEIPYNNGKLWNQCFYLHFTPSKAGNINSAIQIAYGNQKRALPVEAVCKAVIQKESITKQYSDIALKGLVKVGDAITVESAEWPVEIDESANRYVELIVRSGKKAMNVKELSFVLTGEVCYRIAYARGKDFYPRTDIGENQKNDSSTKKISLPINTTIKPGEQLNIRFFPWNISGGKMDFRIDNWEVNGIEME